MKLRKVKLQNVKSYVEQEICFNEGVNFISGINGAGKSTIIEAIGYALFDYSPGTISEFLRYGTKTGTVTVEFCAYDEREYRVVRKLGTSSLWAVFDLECEGELDLHGSRDVKAWLKEAMGIGPEMELEQLFRDIIGVPQGTFVAPFLETPGIRKKKFDAVLKVEQYRNAFINTRGAVKSLEEAVQEMDKALAVLNSETRDYDFVREQVRSLVAKTQELEGQQELLAGQLETKSQKVKKLEQLKRDLEKAEAEIESLTGILQVLASRGRDLQGHLEQAERATGICRNSQKGYERFLDLEKIIRELEKRKKEKEGLERESIETREKAATLRAIISGKEQEITARKAEIAVEQGEKEARLVKISADLEQLQLEHRKMANQGSALKAWETAEEALGVLNLELQAIYREIVGKRETVALSLEREEGELRVKLANLSEVEKRAATFEQRETEYNQARDSWSAVKERLKALERDSLQAADGLCPFLNSPCQNVGGDLKGYFEHRKNEALRELEDLKEQGQKLKNSLGDAVQARDQLIGLRSDENRLKQVLQQKEQLFREIEILLGKAQSAPLSKLIRELDTHAESLQELGVREKILGAPIETEEELDMLLAGLEQSLEVSKTSRLAVTEALMHQINTSSARMAHSSAEKENLLQGVELLKTRLAQLEQEERALDEKRQKLLSTEEFLTVIQKKISEYGDVEVILEESKRAQAEFRKDYDVYMQNQGEASKWASLRKEKERLDKEVVEKEGRAKELQDSRIHLAENFDQVEFDREKDKLEKLKETFSIQSQVLQERLEDLKEFREKEVALEKKLLTIEALTKDMSEAGKTLRLLELARGLLNQAGGPIAKVYLENLSREANEIYRLIAAENAVLEWGADYDITLTDHFQGRERVRTFKQFSGGEQMTAALAVRLALLKQQSMSRIGFFDEPTANLDTDRRINLADTIPRVTGDFDQLFIISHDDTFDSMTDNIIQLKKDTERGSSLE